MGENIPPMPLHAGSIPNNERSLALILMPPHCSLRVLVRVMLLCCSLSLIATPARAIEGLPGSTWGNVGDSFHGTAPSVGTYGMGWVNQGIDWVTLPGGLVLNTYAEYRYRARAQKKEYYDAWGPAVGVEFKVLYFRLGMDYYWQKFPYWPGGVERSNNREYYLTGYYTWDVNKLSGLSTSHVVGFPGAIWFNLTYDAKGLTGSGAMGWIRQGIDWTTLPGGIVFDTFAEYRYRSRTKQYQYYDAQGPAAGIEFRKSPISVGLDYYWETDPSLPGRFGYYELYLTWYIDWDLMKLKK